MVSASITDMIVFRENTEDTYAGIEFASGSQEAQRLIRMAIQYAIENDRVSVTLVQKKSETVRGWRSRIPSVARKLLSRM